MVEYRQNPVRFKFSTVYRKPLSVGQVAKICQVSKKTILNWIYKDALKAFSTFGGHYRIWPVDLQKFFVKTGMDIPFQFIDERQTNFLIVCDDVSYTTLLKESICREFPSSDIITSFDGYEALLLIGERKPQVIILDFMMSKIDNFRVLELLKTRKNDSSMKIIALFTYTDEIARERLQMSFADAVVEKRTSIIEVVDLLKEVEGLITVPSKPYQALTRAI